MSCSPQSDAASASFHTHHIEAATLFPNQCNFNWITLSWFDPSSLFLFDSEKTLTKFFKYACQLGGGQAVAQQSSLKKKTFVRYNFLLQEKILFSNNELLDFSLSLHPLYDKLYFVQKNTTT